MGVDLTASARGLPSRRIRCDVAEGLCRSTAIERYYVAVNCACGKRFGNPFKRLRTSLANTLHGAQVPSPDADEVRRGLRLKASSFVLNILLGPTHGIEPDVSFHGRRSLAASGYRAWPSRHCRPTSSSSTAASFSCLRSLASSFPCRCGACSIPTMVTRPTTSKRRTK